MFVPLHVNSAYSLLTSPMSVEAYVQAGASAGYTHLGLADVNVMSGSLTFVRACEQNGITPLIGLTVQLNIDNVKEELVVYAKNYKGYQHLMALSSSLKLQAEANRRAIYQEITIHADDYVVIFSAMNGPHMRYLKQGDGQTDYDQLEKELLWWRRHFSDDQLFLGLSALENEQFHAKAIIELSEQSGIPLVAMPHIQYTNPDDFFTQQVLEAIDNNKPMIGIDELKQVKGTHALRSPDQWAKMYQDPDDQDSVYKDSLNRLEAAVKGIDIVFPQVETLLPKYPLPSEYTDTPKYLKDLAEAGLVKRVAEVTDAYSERLAYELSVIHDMGFDDYFLLVWDVMNYAHQHHIQTGPGRGSAAGALVAYVLEITDVDPIANDLLFERFLNPERQNMPDIDLDFPDNKRQEVLDYVYRKYGDNHVAQIATFGTFGARQALRNVGSVFGKAQVTLSEWANTVGNNPNLPAETLTAVRDQSQKLRELIENEDHGQLWFDTARKLEGLPRHVSTHAAGVVIADQPLTLHTPLQASSTHIPNTQYTMGDVEAVGLLKVDFLSLSNLTILHDGLAAVGKLTSRPVKALDIPLDDPKTYEIFQHADTNGVFQFESDGIKNVLKQVAPTSIEDVVAVNALYRPGPVQQIPHFVARKHGREAIAYPHPDLVPMLAPTYGVMVYQEQVMQVTQKIAGFSLGEADILRRAIGKKKLETIEKVRKQFISGAIENGYQESVAVQIYDYIEAFANYGFNKSHSFAYSYLAYQLAWIKANYPVAFYYGNLKHTRIYDKKGKNLVLEAKNHGVEVVNPDINKSFYGLSVVDDHQLQLGLGDIRGIPKRAVEEMIQAREAEGPFKDFADFIHRLGKLALKEDILVKLAQAGALDSFGYNRRTLQLEAIPKMITHEQLFKTNNQHQTSLLGDDDLSAMFAPKIVEIDEFDQHQLIENEIETLGQALSISLFEDYESFYQTGIIDYIENLKENDKAFFIGEVMAVKRITTKKNQPMAFVTLEDQTGQISVTAFPEAYITFAKHLNQGNALLVYGKTQKRNDDLQVVLTKAWMLDEDTKAYLNNLSQKQADGSGQADHAGGQKDQLAQSTQAPVCWIRVEDKAKASELKAGLLEVVGKYPGQTRLHFTIVASQENYWLSEKYAIEVTDESVTELIAFYGEENVVVK